MPIFRRITDILSANVYDLVERFEDAEAMLRQAVREMEAAVEETMNAAARSIAAERMLVRQLKVQRDRSRQAWNTARESISGGDDTAARRALETRERHEKLAQALEDQRDAAAAHNQKLRRQLDGLRVRLEEARQTMHVLIARNQAARSQRQLVSERLQTCGANDAFVRFDRLSERIERQEAESQAYLELAGDLQTAEGEPSRDIDVQLAALKEEIAAETAGAGLQ